MEFNPDPTKQATDVLFSCKRSKVDHPPIYFNGSQVIDDQKHIGLTLTPTLYFQKYLFQKFQKAKKNIDIIKHLSNFLPVKTLIQMYKTFLIRSSATSKKTDTHIFISNSVGKGWVWNLAKKINNSLSYIHATLKKNSPPLFGRKKSSPPIFLSQKSIGPGPGTP